MRPLSRRLYAILALVFAAIIFVSINIVADNWITTAKLDLTENGQFTLADGTRNILAKIPEPITLKFYGFTAPRRDGTKRAFFLDGEDIIVAAEGELVKRRYKVVRIDSGTVVMSDTQFKDDSQTIRIAPEAGATT